MSRLEKQCLLASAAAHALLIALLVVGAAFLAPSAASRRALPRLTVVPARLIDEALAGGGGNPNVKPSDAQVKGQTLVRPPTPPPPQPRPVQPAPPRSVEPAQPKRPEVAAQKKPAPSRTEKAPARQPVKSDKPTLPDWLKPATSTAAERAQAAAREQAAAAAAKRRAIEQALQGWQEVRQGFAAGTVVEAWGPGGEAYASYDAFVQAVYDNAWRVPEGLTDEEATCKVRVTIARSGEVLSATIVKPSGNAVLDDSVRQVLREVKFIAPFPEGAKEQQRTYTINFNLRSKQRLG